MGVFPVAQVRAQLQDQSQLLGELIFLQPASNRGIIGSGMGESFGSQPLAKALGKVPLPAQNLNYLLIILGTAQGDYSRKVFGRGPQHGGAADIYIFQSPFLRTFGICYRLLKRIEVDHNHIDGTDALVRQFFELVGIIAAGKNPPMDPGMQGFDPSPQHFGTASHILDCCHCQPRLRQAAGSAACRDQLHSHFIQGPGKVRQAAFIIYAD